MGSQHTATVGIGEKGYPGLGEGLASDGGHQDDIEFSVIEMANGKRAFPMTWGRLIEREKAWLF